MTKNFITVPTPEDCFRANESKVKYLDASLPGRVLGGTSQGHAWVDPRWVAGFLSPVIMQETSPGSVIAFSATHALRWECHRAVLGTRGEGLGFTLGLRL